MQQIQVKCIYNKGWNKTHQNCSRLSKQSNILYFFYYFFFTMSVLDSNIHGGPSKHWRQEKPRHNDSPFNLQSKVRPHNLLCGRGRGHAHTLTIHIRISSIGFLFLHGGQLLRLQQVFHQDRRTRSYTTERVLLFNDTACRWGKNQGDRLCRRAFG